MVELGCLLKGNGSLQFLDLSSTFALIIVFYRKLNRNESISQQTTCSTLHCHCWGYAVRPSLWVKRIFKLRQVSGTPMLSVSEYMETEVKEHAPFVITGVLKPR